MITIVAKNYIKEGQKQAFIDTAKELIQKSRQEEGCISYALYEDLNQNVLTFIEEWKDQAAIDFHNQTEHFTTIVPKLAAFQEQPGEVNFYKTV